MYLPQVFRAGDGAVVKEIVEAYNFATLVTSAGGSIHANHLPALFRPEKGALGTIAAHMARANPQWRHFAPAEEVLLIFLGPHAYVTPSWYAEPGNVPTWNYVAVHAYGLPRLMDDGELVVLLRDLVARHEAGFERPWSPDALPAELAERMRREIVGSRSRSRASRRRRS
jgi:transcriptional regulator